MAVKRGRKMTRQEKAEKYFQDLEDFRKAKEDLKAALRDALRPIYEALTQRLGGRREKKK